MNFKCSNCDKPVLFAEDPYKTPGATKYWKSTFDQTNDALFAIQRHAPSVNKKGKMTVRITKEYVLALFCDAKCGVEYGSREKVSSENG